VIVFNRPVIDHLDLSYLNEAVSVGHISGAGSFTKRAEKSLAEIHDNGQSLLTTSCTHALELAARLLDLQPGDEVIVPSYTFVSSASGFLANGAKVVFADIRPDTMNLDLDSVSERISHRTKAICLVHYAGVGADPGDYQDLCSSKGIYLIEDNAHGLMGSYGSQALGTFGVLSTMSFHETKNLTCGEGGAIHINDDRLFERAEILREKGTNRSRFFRGQIDKYTWVDIGSSWVMSELLAAILSGQLERRASIQARRTEIWFRYHRELEDWCFRLGISQPFVPRDAVHPSHMYFLVLPSLQARTRFIEHMKENGVMVVFHYQPLHASPIGQRMGYSQRDLPVSAKIGDTLIRLPLHLGLTDAEVDHVIESVKRFEV
jgi:dTDP-4-amino-4,6-dideoxygalactose transaminase